MSKIVVRTLTSNGDNEYSKNGVIVVLIICLILFGCATIIYSKKVIDYYKISRNPSTPVTEKVDKQCFKEIVYDDDYGNQEKTKCSAILKYEVNGKTYSTTRTEANEVIPNKVFYNSDDPSIYYLSYINPVKIVLLLVFFGFFLIVSLLSLIMILFTKKNN